MDAQPLPDDATPKGKRQLAKLKRQKEAPAAAKRVREGYPAPRVSDSYRGRQLLNADTIAGMHEAFREGGKEAIYKVMKNQPAIFLKLLVLLVPRELQIEHRGGVKGMTEEQIIDAIEAIEGFLARRRGDAAKVVEGTTSSMDSPNPLPDGPNSLK